MKTNLFILSTLLAFFNTPVSAGNIKEREIPLKVRTYLGSHFPKAVHVKWDFEKDEEVYEAEFKIDDLKYKLEITPTGTLHASKEDVRVSSLPGSIVEYIRSNYPDYQILGANKKVQDNTVTYDIGIKGRDSYGRTRYRNIYFDEQGKLLKR